jgi:hypothetical protein
MKWTSLIVGSLCVATMAACNGNRGDKTNTGAARSGTESGTMQGAAGTATDTGMSGGGGVGDTAAAQSGAGTPSGATGGESSDTARSTGNAGRTDSAKGNQPVTPKSDSIRPSNDSTAVGQ